MDIKKIEAGNFQANEHLALSTLKEMPIFAAFEAMDFQRLLELMQEPCLNIDNVIGKAQMRKICKQMLVQNLTLQTTVRNLQITLRDSAKDFEEAMDQLDLAVKKHTDFKGGVEELMMKEAAEQDAAANQGQLDLPEGEG
ncbi:hypothetical protein PQD74_gp093 [Stenotrophomonas phage Siara]|uniref:Uncharacterized protein n=1 Tax=Stenotrophomonas phage Siara TaxID=2859658 RepID=A0AAE7WM87_9CAUD|nr:hypothetical protein PQD74_gp093 [Stenotrophomonas phage Siara]QYW02071.1 hypothetical protein CPT_Siara_070 [Stenotrophomonas phage Siara]